MAGPRDEDEEGLARMLEQISELSGIDLGEILGDIPDEEPEEDEEDEDFEEGDVGELEDTVEDELDMSNRHGSDFGDYIDDFFDDVDVDGDEDDIYKDD